VTPALIERARGIALKMRRPVYEQALDKDGSLFYEADAQGKLIDPNKHWWAQAEAVVGFYNAWQLSGKIIFCVKAFRIWEVHRGKGGGPRPRRNGTPS